MQNKFKLFIEKGIKQYPYLEKDFFEFVDENTLSYTHWDWNYEDALSFQEYCVDFIKENRALKIYIFCNHPHCFTLGRGLQKGHGSEFGSLVDFDPRMESRLAYKVHRIKRGGGLTFHFPGQWIFYPIINLNHSDYNLKEITYGLLDGVKDILQTHYGIDGLETRREFLGMWRGQKKLASVGIGVKRFVTYHGIAFNLMRDESIFRELNKINPCGLDATTYQCLVELSVECSVAEFHGTYMRDQKYNLLKSL